MCVVMAEKIHKFEAAGLGKAPFRFTGMERRVGPIDLGNGMTSGAPGQPMGTCNYCGQGIANCFGVASADGKHFIVGCDCIRKTGDAGLIKHVKEEDAVKRAAKSRARREAKIVRENSAVAAFREGRCESLRLKPHPKNREGKTAFDYVEWCVTNHFVGDLVVKLIESSLEVA